MEGESVMLANSILETALSNHSRFPVFKSGSRQKFQIVVILVYPMDASWAGIKDALRSDPWGVFSNREKY